MRSPVLALAASAPALFGATLLGVTLLGATLFSPAPARAAPPAPGLVATLGEAAVAPQAVRWVCTYGRCVWRPHSRVRVPVYAQSWAPPPRPRCEYVRRVGPQGQAHWQQVCR